MKRWTIRPALVIPLLLLTIGLTSAQTGGSYILTWWTTDGGGGESGGGSYTLAGTIGQPEAANFFLADNGQRYQLTSGFWQVAALTGGCIKLTNITIDGPTSGVTNQGYIFTANVGPGLASLPINYTWSPQPVSGQGSSQASYVWNTVGSQTISVSVSNCSGVGVATDNHTIGITTGNPSADSDGDTLLDGWEVNGYDSNGDGIIDVDLPTMGANPNKKDIFVEVDFMVNQCLPGPTCFQMVPPQQDAMNRVTQAFANAPVSNPDGSTGIVLHIDYGPNTVMNPVTGQLWSNLSRSNQLPFQEKLRPDNQPWDWTSFDQIKNTQGNFDPERAKIFHYAIFAYQLGSGMGTTSGRSRDIPGSDFIVSLGGWSNTISQQAGTFMHELGHNLGLRHGGSDHTQYKPNYLGVMNYFFQTAGLIVNSNDGNLDYSRFNLPPLDENHLNETVGLNGGLAIANYGTKYTCVISGTQRSIRAINANAPIDWNCNGNANETNIQANINNDNSSFSILTSFNDWPALVFNGGDIGVTGLTAFDHVTTQAELTELTLEEDNLIEKPYKIDLSGDMDIVASLGTNVTIPVTLTNLGTLMTTVSLSQNQGNGWFDLSSVPNPITLLPGESRSIPINLIVPSSRSGEISDSVTVSAIPQESPLMGDTMTLNSQIGPFAQYIAEPVSGSAPHQVKFTDKSVGQITGWLWDFGDGEISASQNATHTYTIPGNYTVRLTVSGPDGDDTMVRSNLVRVGQKNNIYLPIIIK